MSIEFKNPADIQKWLEGTEAVLREEYLAKAADDGAEVIRAEAESRAGHEIIMERERTSDANSAERKVGPSKKKWYLRFKETGAAAHVIKAALAGGRTEKTIAKRVKRGQKVSAVLADKGADAFFGPVVNHPGVQAAPFLRPAIDENAAKAQQACADALRGFMDSGGTR